MFWKRFMTPVRDLSAEEVRRYMTDHAPDAYTLLDVRTPEEYERAHIPGAKLVPISNLADRLGEIDRTKPVIAY